MQDVYAASVQQPLLFAGSVALLLLLIACVHVFREQAYQTLTHRNAALTSSSHLKGFGVRIVLILTSVLVGLWMATEVVRL